MFSTARYSFPLFLTAIALSGCVETKQSPSQVLAKVNKEEITVHQLNFIAARDPSLVSTVEAKQALLDKLIDQQLLVQKAQEMKIDRDPRVLQALEQTRSEILANSVLERLAGSNAEPTQADIDQYYANHTAIFAQRKIYNFDTFVVDTTNIDASTMGALNASKSGAQTKAILDGAKLTYQAGDVKLPAEQALVRLGQQTFDQVTHLQNGDILVVRDASHTNLMQLGSTESAPVDKAQVADYIKATIINDQRKAAVDTQLASLRKQAKIDYVTRFAQTAAPAPQAAASAPHDDTHVAEGMKGLK